MCESCALAIKRHEHLKKVSIEILPADTQYIEKILHWNFTSRHPVPRRRSCQLSLFQRLYVFPIHRTLSVSKFIQRSNTRAYIFRRLFVPQLASLPSLPSLPVLSASFSSICVLWGFYLFFVLNSMSPLQTSQNLHIIAGALWLCSHFNKTICETNILHSCL